MNPQEELALPLNGKKARLTRKDLVDCFARQRLQINDRMLADVLTRFRTVLPRWRELLEWSFLSPAMKQNFLRTIDERSQRALL